MLSDSSNINPAETIYYLYAALAHSQPFHPESGLGGRLIYAGDFAAQGRELLFAANIAGAASIAASSDLAAQRQAVRDGAIDFLVTSLEEALRILKNEIRKRQTVSVGISVDPLRLTESMLERGVLPDLLSPSQSSTSKTGIDPAQRATFVSQGAREIAPNPEQSGEFITWSIRSDQLRDFARWLPKLDACAQAAIPADDLIRHRWLRLAPRYLGRMAQRQRGVVLSAAEIAQLKSHSLEVQKAALENGAESISIQIQSGSKTETL